MSLLPLVDALISRRPDLTLLVTSGTRTSADLLARRLPPGVIHQYLPVDAPRSAARFLDYWRPACAIFVESELWPNLILGARRRGVRLALLSARMTEASARGWARLPAFARTLLGAFDLICAQEARTEDRLAALGAHLGPRLNLKLVGAPLPCDEDELMRLRGAIGTRRVVLAASTHPTEELLIARAFLAAAGPEDLLIVAPRHPERGRSVEGELRALGLPVARRGAGDALTSSVRAYVADTLGELGLFFRLADVVVMGGGFSPGVGGHNPLEPARLGAAILTGPLVFNAAETYGEMFDRVAAIEATDEAALARHLKGLLDNPVIARRMGEAALTYADRQGQALGAALDRLAPLLPA
jgi:3-deoxy-D-manno-octulosonic-acid transferase